MAGDTNTSRWNKSPQHQQKLPNQRPGQQRPQQRRANDHGGFDSLLVGHDCLTELGNGKVIRGVIAAASKYFYLINVNGQIMIVNKAYVVSVMPVQSQNNKQSASTPVGAIGGPYDEEKK